LRFDRGAWRRLPRIMLATIVLAITLIVAQSLLASVVNITTSATGRVLGLVLLVALGLCVYIGTLHVLKVARFGEIAGAITRRL
jgi:peptidoglycan biosynthesis protein MviN/MurJ (putative lipid II flippase)